MESHNSFSRCILMQHLDFIGFDQLIFQKKNTKKAIWFVISLNHDETMQKKWKSNGVKRWVKNSLNETTAWDLCVSAQFNRLVDTKDPLDYSYFYRIFFFAIVGSLKRSSSLLLTWIPTNNFEEIYDRSKACVFKT